MKPAVVTRKTRTSFVPAAGALEEHLEYIWYQPLPFVFQVSRRLHIEYRTLL